VGAGETRWPYRSLRFSRPRRSRACAAESADRLSLNADAQAPSSSSHHSFSRVKDVAIASLDGDDDGDFETRSSCVTGAGFTQNG